jgi:hypothetical protein
MNDFSMNSNTQTTTNQSIKHLALAVLAQIVLSSVHHLYGGIVYDSVLRLSMPVLAGGVAPLHDALESVWWFNS